ncbi:hypothetical protein FJZ33_06575 [Candidatus Poribacteria bacterium]|nr:hypothetical protein [Candidatus Poribacteria bacterium]
MKHKIFQPYFFIFYILSLYIFGCASSNSPVIQQSDSSKGYILYVFVKKTEVMIDYTKKDDISVGTKLDVFRAKLPGMDEPVKLGEIVVDKVGNKMSKAKVVTFTSSLEMERGDRVFPHPITIISDNSWFASKTPTEGWKSNPVLPKNLDWVPCEVLPDSYLNRVPEIKQLADETKAKPIWHPSATSQHGDAFFRKAFVLDAKSPSAKLTVLCGGKTNIYLNDTWVGTAKEWPEISEFNVGFLLRKGRNILAVHTIKDPRNKEALPLIFVVLAIQNEI